MARLFGHVGPARYGDNEDEVLRLGNQGEAMFGELNAKYYEQTMRGNSFVFSTTTAASITALGNNLPTIFNPFGSGVTLVLTKLTLQAAAVGTPVATGLQYGFLTNAGSQIATASPILTGTPVAAVNTFLGGRATKVLWFPAAITFTTAPALLGAVGFNMGSTATETPYNMVDEIDGRIQVPQGTAIQLAASTATSKTFNVSFWGYEVLVPMVSQ